MTVVLGILFAGYLVLGGLDYGVAIAARSRTDLDRVAPFFLGNQVWLVAAVGFLIGLFPENEAQLFTEHRMAVGSALLGVVLVLAAYGMRLFGPFSLSWVARIGALLAAVGWGFALGSWLGAAALLLVLALHGWAFLRRQWIVLALTSAALIAGVFWAGSKITWHPADAATINIIQPIAYAVIPLVIALQLVSWLVFTRTDVALGNSTREA